MAITMNTNQLYANRRSGRTRWQDAADAVLAIWLFISPWVLQFRSSAPAPSQGGAVGDAVSASHGMTAAWNAWILAVVVFAIAISAVGRLSLRQEWANLVLGIWIFIAPWVLGFAALGSAAWDHWIVGALIFLVSLSAVLVSGGEDAGSEQPSPPRL